LPFFIPTFECFPILVLYHISITPKRLSRFAIEVDEALRVGSSGFLGESDAGEEDEGSVLD